AGGQVESRPLVGGQARSSAISSLALANRRTDSSLGRRALSARQNLAATDVGSNSRRAGRNLVSDQSCAARGQTGAPRSFVARPALGRKARSSLLAAPAGGCRKPRKQRLF